MLPVNGRPLIEYCLEALRKAGCADVTIITGHLGEKIHAPECQKVRNDDYENNNILHSLMYARECFHTDLLVTYSDILVNPQVYRQLVASPGDIVIAVDKDWHQYYEGRTFHPITEAEKAFVELGDDHMGRVKAIGKQLDPSQAASYLCAEFLGLWKMTAAGAKTFRAHFEARDAHLSPTAPFQSAKEWRKACVTDLLTDLIASGATVNCLMIERGWAEIDTVQDYERLPAIASGQRLVHWNHPT
jgi:choline kinase